MQERHPKPAFLWALSEISMPYDQEVRYLAIDSRNGPTNVGALRFGAAGVSRLAWVWVSEDSIG